MEYGQYASQILGEGVNRPKKGHDVGDHPPITPMKLASSNELDGDSWKIYDYIVRHFLASVSRILSAYPILLVKTATLISYVL